MVVLLFDDGFVLFGQLQTLFVASGVHARAQLFGLYVELGFPLLPVATIARQLFPGHTQLGRLFGRIVYGSGICFHAFAGMIYARSDFQRRLGQLIETLRKA